MNSGDTYVYSLGSRAFTDSPFLGTGMMILKNLNVN